MIATKVAPTILAQILGKFVGARLRAMLLIATKVAPTILAWILGKFAGARLRAMLLIAGSTRKLRNRRRYLGHGRNDAQAR